MGAVKQAITLVNLLLETVNLALKKSLEILKTVLTKKLENVSNKKAVETCIRRKVHTIMVLLGDKFIIVTIERFCEDDFNISHQRIMSLLGDNLEHFKKELLR